MNLLGVKVRESSGAVKDTGLFSLASGDSIVVRDSTGKEMIWITYEKVSKFKLFCRRVQCLFSTRV